MLFVFDGHARAATGAGLPDEPNVVAVSDYGKTLVVEWSRPAPEIAAAGHVTYVVQERHHVGAEYVPERMTTWATVTRTDKTREQFRQLYAPGRWFQFRVAAINENGTRGYSPPSEQYFVQLGPRESLVNAVRVTDFSSPSTLLRHNNNIMTFIIRCRRHHPTRGIACPVYLELRCVIFFWSPGWFISIMWPFTLDHSLFVCTKSYRVSSFTRIVDTRSFFHLIK